MSRGRQDSRHAIMLHLVATDMDGTFLAPVTTEGHANGVVKERSVRCVATLRAANVTFCIATGRPAPALQEHVETIGLELPCICFNGAAILTMGPGRPPVSLYQRPLEADVVSKVYMFADAEDVCLSYSLVDRAIARCSSEAHRAQLAKYVHLEGVEQTVVESCAELLSLPPPLKVPCLVHTDPVLSRRSGETFLLTLCSCVPNRWCCLRPLRTRWLRRHEQRSVRVRT